MLFKLSKLISVVTQRRRKLHFQRIYLFRACRRIITQSTSTKASSPLCLSHHPTESTRTSKDDDDDVLTVEVVFAPLSLSFGDFHLIYYFSSKINTFLQTGICSVPIIPFSLAPSVGCCLCLVNGCWCSPDSFAGKERNN